ncbi:MAG: hypothetical protein BMS9Abin04_365 [Planctomycetia bacterium]|nr:MAG: hypothetical protein BMS9Abin04_365 [Planctomycetia bacterium]
MPQLAAALDPAAVRTLLARHAPGLINDSDASAVRAVRVVRYKAERRCLIEYHLAPGGGQRPVCLLAKVQAKRIKADRFDCLRALYLAGFDQQSPHGVSIPEPLAVIPELHMWLQRRVSGSVATHFLLLPGGERIAARIAEAIHRVHRAGVPAPKTNAENDSGSRIRKSGSRIRKNSGSTANGPNSHEFGYGQNSASSLQKNRAPRCPKTHRPADELAILQQRLPAVAQSHPRLRKRIARLLEACTQLAGELPVAASCGIHRDFYPDQVLVDGQRLYLVDFDLYCRGDPALDAGNFAGHLIELGLRRFGDPNRLRPVERAFVERFLALSPDTAPAAVDIYTTLTLARHVSLSTQFHSRRHLTERLLGICEQRLRRPPAEAVTNTTGERGP